jgi:hypothetical protein
MFDAAHFVAFLMLKIMNFRSIDTLKINFLPFARNQLPEFNKPCLVLDGMFDN